MLIIEPGTRFLLTIKLNNPSDTNTYYCQAKVYNSVSGALLSTVNLTDNGNKYFSNLWTAPTDGTINGLQVTVLTTAYSDAGYTTESTIYGTTIDNYIVRHLPTNNLGGFTTQQVQTTDYKKIEKIIRDVLAEEEEVKQEELEYPDFHPDIEKQIMQQGEETSRSIADVAEYVRNCMDEQKAEFNKKLETVKSSVVSFLEAHSKQDGAWDKRLNGELGTIKQSIDALLADEEVEKKIEALEEKMDDHHDEVLNKMERPILLKVLPENVKREEKKAPEDQEAERRKMTIKKLLQLSQ